MTQEKPVAAEEYTKEYFLGACGGIEFFERYGPKVLKPSMADALLRAEVEPGMRCLDVGCGRGELLYHLRKKGAWAAGCDFARPALEVARETQPDAPLVLNDVKGLPFQDHSFDRIFLLGVFEHLHPWEQDRCFDELIRILKPGGRIIVDTCTNRHYYKTLTYGARRALALALGLKAPTEMRSEEDFRLHVNEQTLGSMRAFFNRRGLRATVYGRPNPKLELDRLYPEGRPDDFPMKGVSTVKRSLLKPLHRLPGLRGLLARNFVAICAPW